MYNMLDFLFNVRKFFTGFKNNEEKELSRNKILIDIDIKIDKLFKAGYITEKSIEIRRKKLINKAESNNWKGRIYIQRSPITNKLHIIYSDGKTDLQYLSMSVNN